MIAAWGQLIEQCVNASFAANLGSASTFVPGPKFRDGAEAFDAVIIEKSTLVTIEYKASTIKDAIKYDDDPTALCSVLEERFVEGDGKGRKGLAQLSNGIQRFANGDELIDSATNKTIGLARIATIIPVLVHLDNSLRTPGIPHYLSARFKELGRVRRPTVTPLVVLPLTELEELEGQLTDFGFTSLLESFLAKARNDSAAVFFTRTLPILHGKRQKKGTSLKRLDAYLNTMILRLFPNEANNLAAPPTSGSF
jgi:hypothetical protein